ncbi:hypothetical protein GPLA_0465 [Paraglaciecola polaris LMG 21857]|uniref:Uncharacterized protein n=1 Tax=Paraglaciecola polaris LMG 21857 TaxID=1129793 RepID=K6ZM52_9ALTE|nr:hypothetical protein GPLA_0465 [Paraglaciecola polaris LMG 21857]
MVTGTATESRLVPIYIQFQHVAVVKALHTQALFSPHLN